FCPWELSCWRGWQKKRCLHEAHSIGRKSAQEFLLWKRAFFCVWAGFKPALADWVFRNEVSSKVRQPSGGFETRPYNG
ncbi:MAG: hypothetical protein ACYCXI_10255, partial [Dethiobacteraceae bacterium]